MSIYRLALVSVVAMVLISACGGGSGQTDVQAHGGPVSSTTMRSPTSTSSTTSSSTTTSSPASLPQVAPCGGVAAAPEFKPQVLTLACADYNATVSDIAWSLWTSDRATGIGTFVENKCIPNCAQGSFSSAPGSTVELLDPTHTGNIEIFQQVVVTPSSGGAAFTNPQRGAWGWSS